MRSPPAWRVRLAEEARPFAASRWRSHNPDYDMAGAIEILQPTLVPASDENNFLNFFPLSVLVWRDVTWGNYHASVVDPPGSVAAAVPAIAATAGEHSSDEMLVERIAAGDKLAMQVLFARHRTPSIVGCSGSSATRPWPRTC